MKKEIDKKINEMIANEENEKNINFSGSILEIFRKKGNFYLALKREKEQKFFFVVMFDINNFIQYETAKTAVETILKSLKE